MMFEDLSIFELGNIKTNLKFLNGVVFKKFSNQF